MDERAEFEKWAAVALGASPSRSTKPGYTDEYDAPHTQLAWKAWRAGAARKVIVEGMSFGQAIEALDSGHKVARAGWNGKGLSIELQKPDKRSKMTLPYIFMNYPATPASEQAPASHINARVPWLASQTDMLAKDWRVVL